jgi:hypothetical protein
MLCAAMFGVDANLQHLKLHSGARAGEEFGEDDTLDVSYWNLQTGDVVSLSAATDAEAIWQAFAGAAEQAVPQHWLLPPEMRPELQGLV